MEYIKRFLIVLLNWFLFLTMPIWCGLIIFIMIIKEEIIYGSENRKKLWKRKLLLGTTHLHDEDYL